jgi:DNA-directed RNA polymerase subunit RPC12/RpoP
MSAVDLLAELRRRGVELVVERRLRCHAPEGTITPELRGLIVGRKEELIAVLLSEPITRGATCGTCGERYLRVSLTEDDGRLWCPGCLHRRHEKESNRRRFGTPRTGNDEGGRT